MGTDGWFGRSTCDPPEASCPPWAFTDRLMALMAFNRLIDGINLSINAITYQSSLRLIQNLRLI